MAHVVSAVVPHGANPFEVAVAYEVFGIPRPELGVPWYDFRLCTPPGGARLRGGLTMGSAHGMESIAHADTVLVPYGDECGDPESLLVDAIVEATRQGARVASFCRGAFTLAAAGLLDGRRATTHWMAAEVFRRRFPRVLLDPNVLFVDEGQILTSAGAAASIDLALHMVRTDYGAEVAGNLARRMVVPSHREGGQAQYIDLPHEPRVQADQLATLLEWLAANLDRDVTVLQMARRVAMSERTFARRFKESTGTTPLQWLLGQRLRKAQVLLETTALTMERVASAAGFGTPANMREHFRRHLATTPSSYRRAFQGAPSRGCRPRAGLGGEASLGVEGGVQGDVLEDPPGDQPDGLLDHPAALEHLPPLRLMRHAPLGRYVPG